MNPRGQMKIASNDASPNDITLIRGNGNLETISRNPLMRLKIIATVCLVISLAFVIVMLPLWRFVLRLKNLAPSLYLINLFSSSKLSSSSCTVYIFPTGLVTLTNFTFSAIPKSSSLGSKRLISSLMFTLLRRYMADYKMFFINKRLYFHNNVFPPTLE